MGGAWVGSEPLNVSFKHEAQHDTEPFTAPGKTAGFAANPPESCATVERSGGSE